MQLSKKHPKKKPSVTGALATATCALLGSQVAQAEDHGWEFDTALLYYNEKDRVSAVEPAVSAKKTFDGEKILGLKLVLDSLTGASPNGASPSDQPQTFTRPSGAGSYTIDAGDTPLDDTFKDTRAQFSISWEQPITRLMRYNIGANVSTEHDYRSMSVNGGLAWDFNKKNTTLSVGASIGQDTIEPEGGIPTPFASMAAAGATQPRDGSDDSKDILDLVVGVTQVINARTIMQFNYGYSSADGYLNDPYKLLSVVDGASGETLDYVYENRPDSRAKHSFYWKTKYHTSWEDTVDFSYRYMTDDWGINSHTLDGRYRWNVSPKFYVEPHVRYYMQGEADFYRHSLVDGQPLPVEASADYRLAEFDAITIGSKFGFKLPKDQEINFRIESYQSSGDQSPSDAIGVQQSQDMYPDLEATIFQIGYSFKW